MRIVQLANFYGPRSGGLRTGCATLSCDRPLVRRPEEARMSAFTAAELDYLAGQRLGRLATLGPGGAPQNRPVVFTYNPELDTVDIAGMNMASSRKYRNVAADGRVSFVVDDLASTDPWRPRGVEVRGRAETVPGPRAGGELIRIHPGRVLGWGLDSDAFAPPHSRDVRAPGGG